MWTIVCFRFSHVSSTWIDFFHPVSVCVVCALCVRACVSVHGVCVHASIRVPTCSLLPLHGFLSGLKQKFNKRGLVGMVRVVGKYT